MEYIYNKGGITVENLNMKISTLLNVDPSQIQDRFFKDLDEVSILIFSLFPSFLKSVKDSKLFLLWRLPYQLRYRDRPEKKRVSLQP